MVEELVTPDDRSGALDALFGLGNQIQAELLGTVAAADAAKDWGCDGATSMATWLAYRYRVNQASARDLVRVAKALEHLPALRAVFVAGDVSYDQLRVIAGVATSSDDDTLAGLLPGWSCAQAELWAERKRLLTKDERDETAAAKTLWFRRHRSGLSERMTADLPNELAAVIRTAIERRAEADNATAPGERRSWASRCVDALAELAAEDLAAHAEQRGADATTVVIHVREDVASGRERGVGLVDGVRSIDDAAVHRLLCDTRIEFSIDDAEGRTVGIGRVAKDPPRWLRRRVNGREGGCCRWPGCDRRIRHLHHMKHWIRNRGPTNASNLIGVCWFHHGLLHEGGWEATGDGDGEVIFVGPNGHRLRSRAGPAAA